MNVCSQAPEGWVRKSSRLLLLLAIFIPGFVATAADLAALCADRAAIERVYYNHRLGTKPPFEQVSPPTLIKRLVSEALHKESVLKNVYGIAVSSAMIEAEVRRITTTTRAPDVLAELKAALGNDTNRFSQTVAKPIVVERLLRDKFDDDDALHLPQRREVEQMRDRLLSAKSRGETPTNLLALLKRLHRNEVREVAWQLGAHPAETEAPPADLAEVQKRFGPEAQILSSTQAKSDATLYFADLPAKLQAVLRAQLRQAGDVSAVIEMPAGFQLYFCESKSSNALNVATLSVPKRSYEQWLNEQIGRAQ